MADGPGEPEAVEDEVPEPAGWSVVLDSAAKEDSASADLDVEVVDGRVQAPAVSAARRGSVCLRPNCPHPVAFLLKAIRQAPAASAVERCGPALEPPCN
jgi:hypothetical protein